MSSDLINLLKRFREAERERTALFLHILDKLVEEGYQQSNSETQVLNSSKTSKKLFDVLLNGVQITEDPVRITNVLDAIIEYEAPQVTWLDLYEKWNKKTIAQTGYGPILNQEAYADVPDAVKYKYQPNRSKTIDGKKIYVLKSWAMVRDRVTNTPGNFQMLLRTLANYGYSLTPEPVIPPVLS